MQKNEIWEKMQSIYVKAKIGANIGPLYITYIIYKTYDIQENMHEYMGTLRVNNEMTHIVNK